MASSSNSSQKQSHQSQESVVVAPATSTTAAASGATASAQPNVISRKTLQNLAKFVDPNVLLDEETEDMLLAYSDEFLEEILDGACKLAAHRKASALEVGDIELYLERHRNMWISTESNKDEQLKAPKKYGTADAHRQRMALIKKTLKKY